MKRAAVLVVFCLMVSNFAFATGEIYLVDAGGLQYDIHTDVTTYSTSTCSTWWTWTSSSWYTCIPLPTTTSWTSSCWWTTTWASWLTTSCWSTFNTWTASGQANEASYTHTVSASTIGGELAPQVTMGDAFDRYNLVSLRRSLIDVRYANNGPASMEANGRQILFPAQLFDTLEFSRKVFVPENDEFCRWLNIVTNTGTNPELVVLVIDGNLGSDESTLVVDTSNGNTTAETDDKWLVTMQDFDGDTTTSDPRLGHVIQGPNASIGASSVFLENNNDYTKWEFEFVLAPGETGIIMNFVTGQPTIEAARQKAIALSDPDGHEIDYMSTEEKAAVLNFAITPYRPITINSLEDNEIPGDSLVTLREAILVANSGGITDLGDTAGDYNLLDMTGLTGVITLTSSLPTIDSNMIIEGPDPGIRKGAPGVVISGGGLYRIIDASNANLTLKNLTILDGLAEGGNGASSNGGGGGGAAMGAGGAAFVSGGSFKAIGVNFYHNGAVGGDGGDGDDTANAHTQGGGGGGMGGDGLDYAGGGGGVLRGTGGISDGANADGPGAGAAGNMAFGAGGVGGYGGGGGGGGSTVTKTAVTAGDGGAGGFAGGGGGAGGAGGDLPGEGGAGGAYGGAGGGSINGVAYGGGGGGGAGLGGALYVIGCSISVENCTFTNNYAHNGLGGSGASPGGDGEGYGGAIFLDYGNRFWESGNTFENNDASTGENDIHGDAETVPAVLAISLLDGFVLTGDAAHFLVIFSTDVTGVGVSDFSIESTGSVAATVDSVEGEGDRYLVTLALGPSEGQVGIRVIDHDTILDAALVPLGGEGLANGEYSSDAYTVDNVHPYPPILSVEELPGRFFTWTWESGGGGNGTFRWRINESEWTETTDLSYSTPDPADYGPLMFEVQERDDAGNWSESSSWQTVIRLLLYVDGEGGVDKNVKSGDGSGSSWENAASSIWYVLMSAETRYVDIWVKSGLYVESNYLYGNERLYGGFAGTESTLEERDLAGPPTIVTGNYTRAFTVECLGGTVIDGFTLAGCMPNAYPEAKQPDGNEGGALLFSGYSENKYKPVQPVGGAIEPHRVANCVFNGNGAFLGGAILTDAVDLDIENCIFSGNSAMVGGAVFNGLGTLTCTNSTFNGNEAFDAGSALYATGEYTLTNCIFDGNRVECAIYNEQDLTKIYLTPDRIVRNCLFNNNCYADICVGGPDGQSYTGADEINTMTGASNNVDGDPLFATFGPDMHTGPVDASQSDFITRLITINDTNAAFVPGALAGRLIWLTAGTAEGEGEGEGEPVKLPTEGEGEGEGEGECDTGRFICLVILENTETTITALLPQMLIAKEVLTFVQYLVLDYQLLPGSPAIDMGTEEGAPAADIVGGLRPIDVWGTGADGTGTEWDIGAYEADFLNVISITRAGPSPTNAEQVAFNVLFSAPVGGVDADDFAFTPTGTLADFGVDLVLTDDNMLYVVTVHTGTGDGNLRLDLIDDDSISDGEGRLLGGEGEGNGDFTRGEEYLIDKTPPSLFDLAAVPRLAKLGTEVIITFGVSEPVVTTVVTVNGHPATVVTGKNGGLTYSYSIQESDPDGCGEIEVELQDTVGNDSLTQVCDTNILEIDKTPPEFTGIVASPALAKEGTVVSIGFTASEPLDGNPLVTVNGHPAAMAPPKAGGGYEFYYTVLASDPDGPAEIVINGQDLAGNPGEATNNDALTVDKTPPAFVDFMAAPIIVKSGATVTITFDATEPLLDAPVVSLLGTTATFVGNSAGYTYSFVVPPGAPEGPVAVEITGVDLAGNPGMLLVQNAFTVDNTPPAFDIAAVPARAKAGDTVSITVTASEEIGGAAPVVTLNGTNTTLAGTAGLVFTYEYLVTAAEIEGWATIMVVGQDLTGNEGSDSSNDDVFIDLTPPAFTDVVADPALAKQGTAVSISFTVSEPLDGGLTVTVNGHPAVMAPGKPGGYMSTYTVLPDDPDGPAEIVITGQDLAGNPGQATNTDALTIDKTPPAFTGIAADPSAAERGGAVAITFTASESLAADPAVTVNGSPAALVSSVGLDYTYAYTVAATEAFGPAQIAIEGTDLAGNTGTTVDNSALSIVDLVDPSIIIAPPSVDATRGGPVTFLVTYGDDVAEITLAEGDIALTGSGAAATVTLEETGPFTRLITLSSITGDGTLGIAIPAGTAADEYGNPAPEAASELFDVDNTPPVITVLGENPVTVPLNSTYNDAGATALDARDGDITESIDTVSDVDTSVEGDYTVTYDVADALGNPAPQQVRTVHVMPLDECGSFTFPIDGSTITVAGGPEFWFVPILEADLEGAARIEFFLDGVSIGEVQAPPYSISYPMTAGETAVQYELTVQAHDDEDNVLCSSTTTFNVIAAAPGEDGDDNGLPDNPFTSLPDLGNTWFSQNISGETGGTIITAVATLHTCDSPAAPVVVTLVDTVQRVTVAAPDELFAECEMAVVIFQMAPDLDTLLGSIEAEVVLPEPNGVVVWGGMYYLCTVLVSNDQGATFQEIEPARLAADPVSLEVQGVPVPNDAVFYTHDIFADSDALTGVKMTGVPGPWDTSGLANVEVFGLTTQLDVVKPTLFAPYILEADEGENPPAWPWLVFLAALLGISLLGGGGDDGGGGGPCFIATAAYGTPMAADVDTLRELRDRYLLGSAVGTAFVDAYYRVSPAIAGAVSAYPPLAAAIRIALVPVILLGRAMLVAPGAIALLAVALASLAMLRRRKARRPA